MAEDQRILLVRAHVHDDVEMEDLHPESVRVAAGKPFRMVYAYRFQETSNDEESWRFHLRTWIGVEAEMDSERRYQDRRILTDGEWSHLSHEEMVHQPGEYVLNYEATAELGSRPWGEATPPDIKASKVSRGSVRIVAV